MAKCPHCGYTLKIWNIRAECPKCDVNIPNFDWINRLEQDSVVAEDALMKMKQTFAKLRFAFIGNNLRIARLPISVLPLFSFLLPVFTLDFTLPYFDDVKSFNIISLVKQVLNFDFGVIPDFIASPVLGGATIRFLLAIALIFLSALSLVPVSLFFLLRNYKNLHSKGLFITNLIAGAMMISSAVLFTGFSNLLHASTVNAFSGKPGFGLYAGIILFFASSAINLAVTISKAEAPEPKETDTNIPESENKTVDNNEIKITEGNKE